MGKLGKVSKDVSPRRGMFVRDLARRTLSGLLGVASVTHGTSALAVAGTYPLSMSGRLVASTGMPLSGPIDVAMRFFNTATGGQPLIEDLDYPSTMLAQGVYQITLNLTSAQVEAVFGNGQLPVFVEVQAGGKVYPRQQYLFVPYALRVPTDNKTIGFGSDGTLGLRLSGAPAVNQFLTEDQNGNLIWGTPLTSTSPSSVTSTVQNGIDLKPWNTSSGQTGEIHFDELNGNGTAYVGFKAPDSITSSEVWVLPGADGTPGSVLATDGSGHLSWTTPGSAAVINSGQVGLGFGGTGADLSATGGAHQYLQQSAAGGAVSVAAIGSTDIPWATPGAIGTTTPAAGNFTSLTSVYSNSAGSGTVTGWRLAPTFNQTGSTAANTDLLISRTETAVGSGAQKFFDAQVGGVSKVSLSDSGEITSAAGVSLRASASPPLSAANSGRIYFDAVANRFYISENNGAYTPLVPTPTPNFTAAPPLNLTGSQLTLGNVPVASGGTGATSLTTGGVLVGNGTSAVSTAVGSQYQILQVGAGGVPAFGLLNVNQSLTGTLPVASGGTGATSFANNGVLLGNAGGNVLSTAAGSSAQVLRVPTGGGVPAFGAIDLAQSGAVSNVLKISNGGTGTGAIPAYGDLLMGNGSTYTLGTLQPGPTGSITITNAVGSIVLDAAQDIRTTANPFFSSVTGGTLIAGANDHSSTSSGGMVRAASFSGVDGGGTDLYLNAGDGTGVGGSGNIFLQTARPQASSSMPDTYTTAMTIIPSGNVGIGTTAPNGNLHVAGATSIFGAGEGGTPSASTLRGAAAAGANIAGAGFYVTASNGTGTGGSGSIVFQTAAAGAAGTAASTLTSSMVITPSGNVAVGTTAPVNKLDVAGGMAIGASYGGGSANGGVTAPTGGLLVQGNVGIGTTVPGSLIDLNGALTERGMVTPPSLSPANGGRIYFDATNNYFYASQNAGPYYQILTTGSSNATNMTASSPLSISAANITLNTVPVGQGGTGDTTVTTNGMVYGNGTGALQATAAGSQYQILQAGSGGTPGFGLVDLTHSVTNTLPVANGGTGDTTVTSNGVVYGNGTGALQATAAGSQYQVLQAGGSGVPGYGLVDLTHSVSNVLPVANGGTGATSVAANEVFASPSGSVGAPSFRALTAADLPAHSAALITSGVLNIAEGGTGTGSAPPNGALLIGNGGNYSLAYLTAGLGVNITNSAGGITVAATADASTKVSKSGDVMTGTLTLPANGLVAGGSQLVLSGGNVGIGTTSPSKSLQIASNNTNDVSLRLTNTSSSGGDFNLAAMGSSSGFSQAFTIWDNNASTYRLVIDGSGNVGIGTTNPTADSYSTLTGGPVLQVAGPISSMRSGDSGYHLYNYGTIAEWGIHEPAHSTSDNLVFSKFISGVETDYMSITPAGNVGIGITTPNSALHVNGNSFASAGTNNGNLTIEAGGGQNGLVMGTLNSFVSWIQSGYIPNISGSPYSLALNPLGGNVGIGTSTPNYALDISSGALGATDIGISNTSSNHRYNLSVGGTNNGYSPGAFILYDINATTPRMLVTTAGNIGIGTSYPSYLLHVNGSVAGVGAYNQLSDARYKKNVQTLASSLAKILAIRGVTYNWIDEEHYGSKTQIGVIAQEIEKIVPEVVDTGADGVKRVKYSDLIPLVIEAMKQEHADAQIDSQRKDAAIAQLTADSAAKDAAISQLQTTVDQLKQVVCAQSPGAAVCR